MLYVDSSNNQSFYYGQLNENNNHQWSYVLDGNESTYPLPDYSLPRIYNINNNSSYLYIVKNQSVSRYLINHT